MRFAIEHRGRYGLFRNRPRFTLYLSLEFSNEERAISDVRALQNYVFDLSPGYLAVTESRHSPDAVAGMTIGSLALFGVGVLFIFVSAAAPVMGPFAIAGLVGGPALWFYSQLALRHEEQAYVKAVSLAYLLKCSS